MMRSRGVLVLAGVMCGLSSRLSAEVPPPVSAVQASSALRTGDSAAAQFFAVASQPVGQETLPQQPMDDAKQEAFGDNRFRPIDAIDLVIGTADEKLPPDSSARYFDRAGVDWQYPGISRPWGGTLESWDATALCHGPLYFEEVNLERYGKSLGIAQPAVSAGQMFGRVLVLPYLIGATPPRRCVYTLGQGRPGSYMPMYLHRPPVSIRGGLLQATAVTGTAFIVP